MTTKGTSKGRKRRPAGSPSGTTDKPRRKSRPKSGGRGAPEGGQPDNDRRDGMPQSGGRGGGSGRSGGSGGGGGRGGGGSRGGGPRGGGRGGRGPARSGPRGGGSPGGNHYGNGGRSDESGSVRSSRARVVPFEDLFAEAGKGALKIGLALREIIQEVLPTAEERIHLAWKIVLYSEPSEVCGIQIVSKHCNLYFSNGANMEDPNGLLEGTGKAIRHVKVRSLDDLPVEQIKELIREAKRVLRKPIPED